MEKIKVVHDSIGQTITVWFADPKEEAICEETNEEVILMKNAKGKVIGFELLNYEGTGENTGITVETVLKSKDIA